MKKILLILFLMSFVSVFADEKTEIIIDKNIQKQNLDKKIKEKEIKEQKENAKIRLDLDKIEKNMLLDFSTSQVNSMLP